MATAVEKDNDRKENSLFLSSSLSSLSRVWKRNQSTILTSPTPPCRRAFSSTAVQDDDDDDDTTTSNSNSNNNPTIPFLLADIGEGIAEVELLQWFVQEGDTVQQFDRICEVQSDKATVEITSRYDGNITSLEHVVGDMVPVGSPLLFLESLEEEEDGVVSLHTASTHTEPMEYDEQLLHIPTIASQYHLSAAVGDEDNDDDDDDAATTTTTTTRFQQQKVQTTPAIRKLAMEYNLDLSTIVGTGPKGRVLKGDVLTVLRERGLMEMPAKTTTTMTTTAASTIAPSSSSSSSKLITSMDQATLPLQEDTTLEIRGYNRLMVQTMTASLQIPHMVYADEINVNQLLAYKKQLPFLPFIIKAVSQSLHKYPLLNASFFDNNQGSSSNPKNSSITLFRNHNIGIAMDTPRGLIVPVIRHVQEKSIVEIAAELKRLKELATQGTVPSEDLQGATFTLSNIGAIGGGGTYMSPIITPPQVAIGAIGQIQRLPRFANNNNDNSENTSRQVEEAHICTISWGGDHRVVDGATLARFHTQWKGYMQNPISLVQEMK